MVVVRLHLHVAPNPHQEWRKQQHLLPTHKRLLMLLLLLPPVRVKRRVKVVNARIPDVRKKQHQIRVIHVTAVLGVNK
jgi:hypothetical protein